MNDDRLTLDEVRKMAAEIGLTRLTEEHVAQLLRATNVSRARRRALPIADLVASDEPAHMPRISLEDAR